MRVPISSFITACVFVSWISSAIAEELSLDTKGRDIMSKVIERDNGFEDFSADVEMSIVDENGSTWVRRMQVSDLEIGGGGEKRLFVFHYPKDVKGTAVLSHTQGIEEKQWIFLPAFKRVRRISTANKSSPFVGSEFSYEDLASIELEKYRYRYVKMENYSGIECYVVEMQPIYKNSGYAKQLAIVDSTEFIVRRMDYFDHEDELLKTLELEDYQLFIDQYWRPLKLHMVNHQNRRKTLMEWSDIKYRNGLSDNDLSVTALKRAR